MKSINCIGKSVLLISDIHYPYAHRDHLEFLRKIKKIYLNNRSIIISLGDILDFHAISFHDSDSSLPSASTELELAIEQISYLYDLFPRMYVCNSNHDSLLFRRIKHHGIPIEVLRPMQDILNTKGWFWYDEILLKTASKIETYCCHGRKAGYNALAKETGLNCVQGHYHSKFELTYFKTPTIERYNMFVGALIDSASLAFEYAKANTPRVITGCAMIDKLGVPHLLKMPLDKNNRWTGDIHAV